MKKITAVEMEVLRNELVKMNIDVRDNMKASAERGTYDSDIRRWKDFSFFSGDKNEAQKQTDNINKQKIKGLEEVNRIVKEYGADKEKTEMKVLKDMNLKDFKIKFEIVDNQRLLQEKIDKFIQIKDIHNLSEAMALVNVCRLNFVIFRENHSMFIRIKNFIKARMEKKDFIKGNIPSIYIEGFYLSFIKRELKRLDKIHGKIGGREISSQIWIDDYYKRGFKVCTMENGDEDFTVWINKEAKSVEKNLIKLDEIVDYVKRRYKAKAEKSLKVKRKEFLIDTYKSSQIDTHFKYDDTFYAKKEGMLLKLTFKGDTMEYSKEITIRDIQISEELLKHFK